MTLAYELDNHRSPCLSFVGNLPIGLIGSSEDCYEPTCLLVPASFFFYASRRRHTRCSLDWSSDVCSSDLISGQISPADAQRSADLLGLALSAGGSVEVFRLARDTAEGFHDVLVAGIGGGHRDRREPVA